MRQVLFWEALILSTLLLYLSRTYTAALYMFLPLYFFLVYHIIHSEEKILLKLTALSVLTAISLSLRFDYLIWGDPWADYAINKGILESGLFPLRNEEPLARFLTVFSSILTGINPMTVQKFLIPALGSLTVPTLYVFMKDFMPERGARYSGLLLMVATPYLHWVTQGVRESLGLFMGLLALYLSYRAVKTLNKFDILMAFISVILVTITHPRAALIFFVSWVGFSLFINYSSKKSMALSIAVTIFSVFFTIRWWEITSSRVISQINLVLTSYKLSYAEAFIILMLSIVVFYFLSAFIVARTLDGIIKLRKTVYVILAIIIFLSLIYIGLFLGGKFKLPYPFIYYINNVILFALALFGFYYFFEKEKFPIIAWAGSIFLLLTLNFVLNYGGDSTHYKTFPLSDPLRFFEFASIPLASLAGYGAFKLKIRPDIIIPLIILISLITSFPTIVFLGNTFAPNNPLYDERSWLISHEQRELQGIEWINESIQTDSVTADLYIDYSLKPFGKKADLDRGMNGLYKFLTKRMLIVTDFGETIFAKRAPISEEVLVKLANNSNKIYDNTYAEIYN